jgi:hypothetical protein
MVSISRVEIRVASPGVISHTAAGSGPLSLRPPPTKANDPRNVATACVPTAPRGTVAPLIGAKGNPVPPTFSKTWMVKRPIA